MVRSIIIQEPYDDDTIAAVRTALFLRDYQLARTLLTDDGYVFIGSHGIEDVYNKSGGIIVFISIAIRAVKNNAVAVR